MKKALIHIKNMSFYAYHGDDKKEQELGQRYEVDITLSVDTEKAIEHDDVDYTVNYKDVYILVEAIVTGERYRLLETLTDKLAVECLDRFDTDKVHIKVRKLKPPIQGIMDYIEIETTRDSGDI